MDLIQSKWKLIVGIVLGLAVLSITIVLLAGTTNKPPPCSISHVRPTFEVPQTVASEDFLALASFSGYLEMTQAGKSLYMSINLVNVSTDTSTTSPILVLTTDCAKLTVRMILQRNTYYAQVIDIAMDEPIPLPATVDDDKTKTWKQCQVSKPAIWFPSDNSYACKQFRQTSCFAPGLEDELNIRLTTSLFSFEIFGNPTVIKHGQYSKSAHYCPA